MLVVLVTSFFCSLSEASLLSSSRLRLHSLADKSASAKVAERLKSNLDRPVAAILILNTLANTGGAAIAGREYARTFEGEGIAIFTTLFTIAVLVLSELLPKTLGVRYSTSAVVWLARPLDILTRALAPLTFLVERMTRMMGSATSRGAATHVEDLRAMVRLAASSKAIGRQEQSIIEAAATLPRILVRHLMIHRPDVVYLALTDDDDAILLKARQSMHSRLLLGRTGLDDVVGIVNIKEVLWRFVDEDDEEIELKRILGEAVREPLYVRDDMDAVQLLQAFSHGHEHMAIVHDGAKRVVGVVTLEDVIEELVGEVDDEFDRSPEGVERLGVGVWHIGGGTLWSDAARAIGLPADAPGPEEHDLDGRYDLHDLAEDRLPGKLRTGASFAMGPWRFKVLRMRRGKVLMVEAFELGRGRGTGAQA